MNPGGPTFRSSPAIGEDPAGRAKLDVPELVPHSELVASGAVTNDTQAPMKSGALIGRLGFGVSVFHYGTS